jgi:hypothetical protein
MLYFKKISNKENHNKIYDFSKNILNKMVKHYVKNEEHQ